MGRAHGAFTLSPVLRCFVLETLEGSETEISSLDVGGFAVISDEFAEGLLVQVLTELLDRAVQVFGLGVSFPLNKKAELLAYSSVAAEGFHVEVLLAGDYFGRRWWDVLGSSGKRLSSIHVLLQVLGVDDWVDLHGGGEVQLVGDGSDDLEDLVGAVVAGLELLLGILGRGWLELFGSVAERRGQTD